VTIQPDQAARIIQAAMNLRDAEHRFTTGTGMMHEIITAKAELFKAVDEVKKGQA
jgi:hypothetical protein